MIHSLGDAALVFLTSAAVCIAVGRVAIQRLAHAQGIAPLRYEDCPPLQAYQESKRRIPTMGGLFVLAAAILVSAFSGGFQSLEGLLVFASIAGCAAIGFWDDCLKFKGTNAVGLRAMPKLLMALVIGAAIGWAILQGSSQERALPIPWVKHTVKLGWGWIPFSMVVIAGCAHAVNLTDGMDGLASGCVAIALMALAVWAIVSRSANSSLLPWCAALAGACVGFLWFNSFPASVFLGDVGALGLGGALGAISLFSRTALWLLIIGGIFVVEALSVMLQVASYKWRGKKRIFRVAPIHHHFHLGGISEPKLIVRFWIVALILAMLSLTALELS